jgi:hypothetical protein
MAIGQMRFPPFRLIHAAYVASDLDRGQQRMSQTHGVETFERFENIEVLVPGGAALIDFVLGDANGTPVEVITPRGGQDAVYRQSLSADPDALVFHHFASRVTAAEWRDLMATIEANGLPTPVLGSAGEVRYVYVDLRPTLGHMFEFIHYGDEDMQASPLASGLYGAGRG